MSTAATSFDGFTAPFWAAAEQQQLVRPYCARCDRSFFTPQLICPGCQRRDWEWRTSDGRGTVYSHTTVHRAPETDFLTPYVLAIVDLWEGWSMLTTIVDQSATQVAIGDAVEVRWIRSKGRMLPAFVRTAS
jgi:uncharacterized OB-fold protein